MWFLSPLITNITFFLQDKTTFFPLLQVLNEANLTNAVLVRSVLTRSDLGGAVIEGADFSDAVLDLTQKQVSLQHQEPCFGFINHNETC